MRFPSGLQNWKGNYQRLFFSQLEFRSQFNTEPSINDVEFKERTNKWINYYFKNTIHGEILHHILFIILYQPIKEGRKCNQFLKGIFTVAILGKK